MTTQSTKASQSRSSICKWLIRGSGVLLIIGIGLYFGVGYYIFNLLGASNGGCQQPMMYDLQENQPDNFGARYRVDDDLLDVSQYQMPIFEDVQFTPRGEDVELLAWYIPATTPSDAVVIIVHGIAGCRREPTQLIPASMLTQNGFNVFVMDVRNHGDSEIDTGFMAAGNREYRDVLGAFDYLQTRGFDADKIGVMGISLGAGTATIAFGQEPAIPALYLESPFSNLQEMIINTFERDGLPTFLVYPTFHVALLNGINYYEHSPDKSILNHDNRPILMTHGSADTRIPLAQAETLLALAGNNAELVIIPDLDHVEAIYVTGDEYAQRLADFFTETLLPQ
ncbi:MAG: alpha/beta fold hydrolase [Chloroflexota bacterium]